MLLLIVTMCSMISMFFISDNMHDIMRPAVGAQEPFSMKKFAAGCSRDVIKTGAERLGWTLEELMEKTLQAQRSCEESVAAQMAAL